MRQIGNLLLVDDDEAHRYLLRRLLRQTKLVAEITEADSIESALKHLISPSRNAPDLVVTDLNLKDGRSTALLSHPQMLERKDSRIPIVILSTSSLEADIEECRSAGAREYIVKSEDFQELGEQLGSCLRRIVSY